MFGILNDLKRLGCAENYNLTTIPQTQQLDDITHSYHQKCLALKTKQTTTTNNDPGALQKVTNAAGFRMLV